MNFETFQQTRKTLTEASEIAKFMENHDGQGVDEMPHAIHVYEGECHIFEMTPGNFHLHIATEEYDGTDLAEIEKHLFEWADGEIWEKPDRVEILLDSKKDQLMTITGMDKENIDANIFTYMRGGGSSENWVTEMTDQEVIDDFVEWCME